MFWKSRKPRWLVSPLKVALGSVIGRGSRNLSRSHVRVKYQHDSEVRFLPLGVFIRNCQDLMRSGRSLGIEHLLVAPILKQRYAKFFDLLTDWEPATRRVTGSTADCPDLPQRKR
jgi:hypothetical protein